jgi:hypothetical protein
MDIERCEKEAANDGSSRCVGGTMGANGSWPSNDLCSEGHGGPMCKLCVASNETRPRHDAYFDEKTGRCKDCPTDIGARGGALVGGVVGVLVLAYVVSHGYRHWSQKRTRISQAERNIEKAAKRITKLSRRILFYMAVAVGVFERTAVPRFKILITFYQVIVVLPNMYGTDMPTAYCELSPLALPQLHTSCLLTPSICLLMSSFGQTHGTTGSKS